MNVRTLVVLLLLANLLFWAWTQGALDALGLLPPAQPAAATAPPDVRAEAVHVLPVEDLNQGAAADAVEPDPAPEEAAVDPEAAPAPAESALEQPDAVPERPQAPSEAENEAPADAVAVDPALEAEESDDEAGAEPVAGEPELRTEAESEQEQREQDEQQRADTVSTDDATRALRCRHAEPFDVQQAGALRDAAAQWPQARWEWLEIPGQMPRWMAYVGGSGGAPVAQERRDALQAVGIDVDQAGAGFAPGWSLGRFASAEASPRALHVLQEQADVADARVIQERATEPLHFLRTEARSDGGRQRSPDQPLRPCS